MKIDIDNRQFSAALREYMQHTKRDLAQVINQKSYSICMAAAKLTHKATAAKIRKELKDTVQTRSGRGGPRGPILINWKCGQVGQKGLYGPDMAAEEEAFTKKRAAHTAFLRSAWLPAVAAFARSIGKSVGANATRWARVSGIGKGMPAKPGFNPTSEFWNAAPEFAPSSTRPEGAVGFASIGLQQAMAQEVSNMAEHVARKLQQTANKFNAR